MQNHHESDMLSGFGDRLIECRKKLQLTRQELANRLVWHRNTIDRYEAGSTLPDLRKVVQLAEALDVDPAYLAFGKNRPASKPVLPEPVRKALASIARIIEEMMRGGWVLGR